MKEINDIILDYLKVKESDYALMICGDWGCGKTYFLEHEFKDIVEKTDCPLNPDEEGGFKRKVKSIFSGDDGSNKYSIAYVSLYGISSTEDFYHRVCLGVNPFLKNKVVGIAGLLGAKVAEVFGAELTKDDVSKLVTVSNNHVLVFDDLERICSDKISVKEVLSLINSYVEHDKIKVVIVCNEKAYEVDENGNGRDVDYWKFKEKTVRYSCVYEANIPKVYDTLIEPLNGDYKKYLEENKSTILSIFGRGGKKNLRTLKFFIDSMEQVFGLIPKVKYHDDIARSISLTYLIYSIEYKAGNKASDIKALKEKYEIDLDPDIFGLGGGQASEAVIDEPSYYDALCRRYGTYFSDDMLHLPCLVDYIESGLLDASTIQKESNDLNREFIRKEKKLEFQVYQELSSFSTIEDDEVIGKIDTMLQYVKEGKYNQYDLLNVYSLLVKYHVMKINDFILTEAIDKMFMVALDGWADRWTYNPDFFYKTPVWDERERGQEAYEKYMAIKYYALEINNQSRIREKDTLHETFLKHAESGDVAAIHHYRENNDNTIPISGVDWNRICYVLENGSNPMACELAQCLEFLLSDSSCIKPDDEQQFKDIFIKWLDDYSAKEDHRIRRMYILELKKHIRMIFR